MSLILVVSAERDYESHFGCECMHMVRVDECHFGWSQSTARAKSESESEYQVTLKNEKN